MGSAVDGVLGVMSSTTNSTMVPGSGSGSSPPMGPKRWYFSEQQLTNTPSLRAGIPVEKELSYRQQAANFIQDMGQRLEVTQLCINTAIVYMQRFYMFHSFDRFHRNSIASAALFLAAKVEEQPRKLEHVIKVAHMCLHRGKAQLDVRSDAYQEQAQELVTNENILLQTLGFDVAIDHPHTHVVKCCQLVKAAKELAQTSYFMATNSLHLTTMCLRYTPTIVACVCIHLACKWSNYRIPLSAQQREWFSYIDAEATHDLLDKLTDEFLAIFDKCPSKLKNKIRDITQSKDEEDRRLSGRRGDYDPTELFSKVGTDPSAGKHRGHHRSQGGQANKHHGPHGSHPHHGGGHHHRSSSSSQQAATASSGSSQHPMQHPISKHVNPAMFDPNNMRNSSHREKHSSSSKPMMNPNPGNAVHPNQILVSSQQQQKQGFVNNHGHGGQQVAMDAYGRPVHNPSKVPASATNTMQQQANMGRSSSQGVKLEPGQQPHQGHHHQQRPQNQQQQHHQQQQQQQRNMSLPYSQPQQKSSRSSQQQHRHSSGHDSRYHQQHNVKPGHMGVVKREPQLPPPPAQQQPPLPPSEPPKPAPPPPPMPPSPVTSMKPPKSIFDIDSPPASMPAPKSHSRNHRPPTHLTQQPPPPPITSSTLSQPKVEKLDIGDIFEPDMEDASTTHTSSRRERTTSGREISPAGSVASLKLAKVEEMTGFEKLRDGRSTIKLPKTEPDQTVQHQQQPQQPTKSMVVSIPLLPTSTQTTEVMQQHHGHQHQQPAPSSSSSSNSHKKPKKEKKQKKDKKDRDKSDHRHKSSNGETGSDHQRSSSSSSKKHKHKHKEKEKDRDHHHTTQQQQAGPPPGLKLKIKPIQPGMSSSIAPSGSPNVVQPLKICIGANPAATSSSSNSSRKRHRQHSDSSNSSMDSMGGQAGDPARKMSRVMGTSTEQESTFLSGRVNLNYQKKKVI